MNILWRSAPIYTKNLIQEKIVSVKTNRNIKDVAMNAFNAYCSTKNHKIEDVSSSEGRRQRKRGNRRRTATSSTTLDSTEGLTINDYFFEHQRVHGFINGTPHISKSPEIHELNQHILSHIEIYLDGISDESRSLLPHIHSGLLTIDLWAAIQQGKGAYHKEHVHEDALVSGVYYVNIPNGSAPLVFRNQDDKVNATEDNIHLLEPSEGQIVIFPPWLPHSVPEREYKEEGSCKDPRISFAFNLRGLVTSNPWSITRISL